MTLEDVKSRIPVAEYKVDMLVTKALELVKETAVVDNTVAEEAVEETTEAAAE
jgi:trigger factor